MSKKNFFLKNTVHINQTLRFKKKFEITVLLKKENIFILHRNMS